jgi:hypothetical protein
VRLHRKNVAVFIGKVSSEIRNWLHWSDILLSMRHLRISAIERCSLRASFLKKTNCSFVT